jgi:hypothetical protein
MTSGVGPCALAVTAWPNGVDRIGIALFVTAIIVLPLLGYWLTALDIRAYLRALRGALVRVAGGRPELPAWLRDETPPCLRALGLTWPCTEADVKRAYRRLAKELHPDRGGDVRRFLLLQDHQEQACRFVRRQANP